MNINVEARGIGNTHILITFKRDSVNSQSDDFFTLLSFRESTTRLPVRKPPVYTMGSADPRAYSRNKRGIAGGLVWINFDRDSLLAMIENAAGKFVADIDDFRPQWAGLDQIAPSQRAIFSTNLTRSYGPSVGDTIDQFDQLGITGVSDNKELGTPWYHDQILPFDIALAGTNEYGAQNQEKACSRIVCRLSFHCRKLPA